MLPSPIPRRGSVSLLDSPPLCSLLACCKERTGKDWHQSGTVRPGTQTGHVGRKRAGPMIKPDAPLHLLSSQGRISINRLCGRKRMGAASAAISLAQPTPDNSCDWRMELLFGWALPLDVRPPDQIPCRPSAMWHGRSSLPWVSRLCTLPYIQDPAALLLPRRLSLLDPRLNADDPSSWSCCYTNIFPLGPVGLVTVSLLP